MQNLSSENGEEIFDDQNNNNNFKNDETPLIGSADTLKRAMTVNTINEMFDCIKDMKFYAKTIEQDLPAYLDTIYSDENYQINTDQLNPDDLLELAKQRLNNNRYILLNDLLKQDEKKSSEYEHQKSTVNNPKKSFLDKQAESMKNIIAAQPSAFDAIYLEALLNPDQWEYDHQLLQASPMDMLTTNERKRLNELLYKLK